MIDHRILLVDDDALLRQSLCEQLAAEGFGVSEAADAAGALAVLAEHTPDAVLLDAALPDMAGDELCRELRRRGLSVPIILLTAAGEAKAPGSRDCGADEHVAKPFRLGALLTRLRALLRRSEQAKAASLRIGPYSFEPAAKLMVGGGDRRVRLTDKEVAILKYLYDADRVIARETLLHEVWGYHPGATTHTVETHVYRLRRKIEADPANARILVTEAGGYRLVP